MWVGVEVWVGGEVCVCGWGGVCVGGEVWMWVGGEVLVGGEGVRVGELCVFVRVCMAFSQLPFCSRWLCVTWFHE